VFIRVDVGRLRCEQRGRRPAEFRILSFVAGGPVPQEGGGLGRAQNAGSEGAYGTKAPMKCRHVWRRRWPRKSDFASFWLNYILAMFVRHDKICKIHLCRQGCKVLTTYTEANSSQLVATHQCPTYFNKCYQIRCPFFGDAKH